MNARARTPVRNSLALGEAGRDPSRLTREEGTMTATSRSAARLGVAAAALASLTVACADIQPVGPDRSTGGSEPLYAAGGQAFVILETPETTGWPIYTHMPFFTTGGEVLIILLRDPACIPDGFNFFLGWAAEHPLTCPFMVHTKEWWLAEDLELIGGPWGEPFWDPNLPVGTGVNPDYRNPTQARFDGTAVPVWVVSAEEFGQAVVPPAQPGQRPTLLFGAIRNMDRIEGTATSLDAVQQNSNRATSFPSQRPNHSVWMASGVLEDGRSFRAHLQERRGIPNHLEVVIE
jgi:hypothetical protein